MRRRHVLTLAIGVLAGAAIGLPLLASEAGRTLQAGKGSTLVYFGTYTGPKSKGIYVARLDAGGALSPPQLAGESVNPSYLAIHPTRDYLYAVNEIGNYDGTTTGSVSAFAIDRATGALTALNRQSSGGGGPAHLIVDQAGRNVLVANYGGGSVAVLPIDPQGTLRAASAFIQHKGSSVNPERQKEPHAHSIILDAANRFAYVPDLGLDKVMIYRFDAARGSLAENEPPFASVRAGAGPRHFAIHPRGPHAYVINEIDCTVTAFTRDSAKGGLTMVQTVSTLPPGQSVMPGYSTADIQVHPSGKFVYGSNRGHDSIVVYTVDEKTGRLTFVQTEPTQGSTPRAFGIDPTGTFLLAANQRSDSVVVFRIDQQTGRLTPTGVKVDVGAPVSVKFTPAR